MSNIRVACQTYTWEMLGAGWRGKVTDLLDWIAEAGYAGVEITNNMVGEFRGRPAELWRELESRGLSLAAFAYSSPSGFTDPDRWADDLTGAEAWIGFLRHFPEPRLGLGGAANPKAADLRSLGDWRSLDQAIRFYNRAGQMGAAAGVSVNVHPHSHFGSLLETAEEYRYLLERLDPACVSLGPDTGHIVRGGQDLRACLRTCLPRITHLHLKDANWRNEWVGLGDGVCVLPVVMALLEGAGYAGWVVCEEESEAARLDGRLAIRKNRAYLRSLGY